MRPKRVTVGRGGRMVIPAAFRKRLGVEPGDQVVIDLKDGDLRVRSLDAVGERAQARVRRCAGRRLACRRADRGLAQGLEVGIPVEVIR